MVAIVIILVWATIGLLYLKIAQKIIQVLIIYHNISYPLSATVHLKPLIITVILMWIMPHFYLFGGFVISHLCSQTCQSVLQVKKYRYINHSLKYKTNHFVCHCYSTTARVTLVCATKRKFR